MAIPEVIILVRHAQSDGNENYKVYSTTPDHKIKITKPLGHSQAKEAGVKVRAIIGKEPVEVYLSGMDRAQETFDGIRVGIRGNRMRRRNEPRLGEQEWGILASPEDRKLWRQKHKEYGPFYYRVPQGESSADVYGGRMGGVIDTLWRDFKKKDYAKNVLIVSHGMTIKILLMRWFHLSIDVFEKMEIPHNCQIIVMRRKKGSRHFYVEDLPVLGLTKEDFKPVKWEVA
jgi:broad specificity phosphatase PhoE